MTKSDLIESLHAHVALSKKEALEVGETVLETLKASLARGEKVKISGFGTFQTRTKKRRFGRNPQTGEPLELAARRVVTFRPSSRLKGALNAHADTPHTAPPKHRGR